MKLTPVLASVVLRLSLALRFPCRRARAVPTEGKIAVVAAENFYGDIARQIGGDRVAVVSIMNNPDQDPHLFETTPGIVRQIANAQIAIVNGADYDPWMEKLLAAAPRPGRLVINVAALTARKAGDNPHLWYDPAIIRRVAMALEAELEQGGQRARCGLFRAAQDLSRLARARHAAHRADQGQIRGPGRDRHRTGVRLYG